VLAELGCERAAALVVRGTTVHRGFSRALIRESLQVEPEVQGDGDLDDADDEHKEQRRDEGELDQCLAALAAGTPEQTHAPSIGARPSKHEGYAPSPTARTHVPPHLAPHLWKTKG
jgi:hypothetical protein